jgi:hypothetical protein
MPIQNYTLRCARHVAERHTHLSDSSLSGYTELQQLADRISETYREARSCGNRKELACEAERFEELLEDWRAKTDFSLDGEFRRRSSDRS